MGNLYNKINDLCEKRGISGYRMCKDTGLPPSMMTELKKGRQSSISIDKLKKIADYFNVPLEYFRDDYEEIKKSPSQQVTNLKNILICCALAPRCVCFLTRRTEQLKNK